MAEKFSWAAGLDVGLGALGGLADWFGAREGAKAQFIASEGRRKAQNIIAGSRNSLSATVRSLNTARLLEASGRAFNAEAENLSRQRSGAAGQRFEQSIRNAEADGQAAANIAASGVGGSALTAVATAMALQHGRLEFGARQQEGQVTYNTIARMSGIMAEATGARDMSMIGGNTDQIQAINNTPSAFGLLTSLTKGVLSKKDSLQTFLGSLEPTGGAAGTSPVYSPTVVGTPLDTLGGITPETIEGAITFPVESRAVTPYYSSLGGL